MTTISSHEDNLRALAEKPKEQTPWEVRSEQLALYTAELKEMTCQLAVCCDRIEGHLSEIKNCIIEYKVNQYAFSLVVEVGEGLEYVRTISKEEMAQMAQQAIAAGHLAGEDRRSFVEADVVIETRDGDSPCYLAVEVSYTANQQDVSRARRNANIISELKGCPARPVIASVRNYDEVESEIQEGNLPWYQISQRQLGR